MREDKRVVAFDAPRVGEGLRAPAAAVVRLDGVARPLAQIRVEVEHAVDRTVLTLAGERSDGERTLVAAEQRRPGTRRLRALEEAPERGLARVAERGPDARVRRAAAVR